MMDMYSAPSDRDYAEAKWPSEAEDEPEEEGHFYLDDDDRCVACGARILDGESHDSECPF